MFQKALLPAIATALRLPLKTVALSHRRLLEADLISGRGQRGKSAPGVNVEDTARTIVGVLGSEQPHQAPAALEGALGLVAIVGGREQGPVEALELVLAELVAEGDLGEAVDFKLAIGRPQPSAVIELVFADGARLVEFRDRVARGEDVGANRWATIGLNELTAIADEIRGGPREQRPSMAEMFLSLPTLPGGGVGMVMARARSGPPAKKGARRARTRRP